jgi:acyl-CoA thioester hydrolase
MTTARKAVAKNGAAVASAATIAAEPASPPTPMARVPMTVRWGDLDAFNHVNNATFLVYAQEARLAWLAGIDGPWFDESMMPVVAAAQVNFRRQLAWPSRIAVELAATRVGTSSLTIAHRIVADDDGDCVHPDGVVVMVWIDPANGRSVPLPPAIRAACQGV